MILITGGTGFIGNVLIKHLLDLGYPVKLLLRPSSTTPNLPKGLALDVAVSSLTDTRGLRAAMKDVDIVFHLASAESQGREAQLTIVDINGTEAIIQAAKQAKIKRFIYISHLGADRASAYPLLKSKGIAEHSIKSSDLPYTIFRSAYVYGENDHFTNALATLLKLSPYFVMLPDDGSNLLQPIWVDDLATILSWSLEMPNAVNATIEVGGPEYLSFKQICEIITPTIGVKRKFVDVPPTFLNILTELLEILTPNFPTSVFWLDYLAMNRTTDMDVLPRMFKLLPARMSERLDYLAVRNFRKNWWRSILKKKVKK